MTDDDLLKYAKEWSDRTRKELIATTMHQSFQTMARQAVLGFETVSTLQRTVKTHLASSTEDDRTPGQMRLWMTPAAGRGMNDSPSSGALVGTDLKVGSQLRLGTAMLLPAFETSLTGLPLATSRPALTQENRLNNTGALVYGAFNLAGLSLTGVVGHAMTLGDQAPKANEGETFAHMSLGVPVPFAGGTLTPEFGLNALAWRAPSLRFGDFMTAASDPLHRLETEMGLTWSGTVGEGWTAILRATTGCTNGPASGSRATRSSRTT